MKWITQMLASTRKRCMTVFIIGTNVSKARRRRRSAFVNLNALPKYSAVLSAATSVSQHLDAHKTPQQSNHTPVFHPINQLVPLHLVLVNRIKRNPKPAKLYRS